MTKLIGITGLKGSGKTTVGEILQNKGYRRQRMAGILKDMLRVLGLDERQIDGDLKEEPSQILGGKTPRWAMQSLGTEWGRNLIDENIWVNAMEQKLRLYWQGAPHFKFVIDDIRFENEAQMIKRLGGTLWAVFRPGLSFDTSHASESNVLNLVYNIEISNTGTLEDLHRKVLEAL